MQNSSIMHKLKEVDLEIFKAVSARYKNLGLDVTPVQSRIIMFLYDSDISICQRDIEKFVSCNKSTMSAVLNTMEKNELIVRKGSSSDSRRKIIELTDKSINVANILMNDRKKMNKILSAGIIEEEYVIFTNILEKIKKNLERL